jgi:hypothetical protein
LIDAQDDAMVVHAQKHALLIQALLLSGLEDLHTTTNSSGLAQLAGSGVLARSRHNQTLVLPHTGPA